MKKETPGRSHRKGISIKKLHDMFPDDDKAREWLEKQIWPGGPHCPHCGTYNVQCNIKHKTMTHRCRDCKNRPQFSLKTGTIMQASNLGYRDWAIAIYLMASNIKGISALKLSRELEIAYTSAWHMAHRLRAAFEAGEITSFSGPVEADETYIGGKRKNMSLSKRRELKDTGRGTVGKAAVVGVKDRDTNKVRARVVSVTDTANVAGFVASQTKLGAKVYTDQAKVYKALSPFFDHESVNHSVSEYVREQAHTNGMESFWSMLKRGYHGIYHSMSPQHLHRYVSEFAGRHNIRDADTEVQMSVIARQGVGKRLRRLDLAPNNGLSSGERS